MKNKYIFLLIIICSLGFTADTPIISTPNRQLDPGIAKIHELVSSGNLQSIDNFFLSRNITPNSLAYKRLLDAFARNAVSNNQTEALKVLVSKYKLNLNHSNKSGKTILMTALEQGKIGAAEYLIDITANLDKKDKNGESILDKAKKLGNKAILDKLAAKGLK